MDCKVKIKALDSLKEKNVISNTREILDKNEFDRLNQKMTQVANEKYNLGADSLLFKVETNEHTLPFGKGRKRFVMRALPDESLFSKLDTLINTPSENTDVKEYAVIVDDFMNNTPLLSSEGYKYLYTDSKSKRKYASQPSFYSEMEYGESYNAILDKILGVEKIEKGDLIQMPLRDVLRNSMMSLDLNQETMELVGSLLKLDTTIEFNVPVSEFNNPNVNGHYIHSLNLIQIRDNRLDKGNEYAMFELILHEAMHAATLQATLQPLNDAQRKFRQDITSAFEYYKNLQKSLTRGSVPYTNYQYGFTNVDEFIAEIMSNPSFREEIDGLIVNKGESLWDWVVNLIKDLLGLRRPNSDKLVKYIAEYVDSVASTNRVRTHAVRYSKREPYSPEFSKEIYNSEKLVQRILSSIDSVAAKSAAKRGPKNETSTKFQELRKLINDYAKESSIQAIYKFIEFANEELWKMNASLETKMENGTVDADYMFRAKSYSSIYNSLEDVSDMLQNLKRNKEIKDDEFKEIKKTLTSAKEAYDTFHTNYIDEAKGIMADRLSRYNMKPYDRRRRELEREYNSIKPEKDKKKWIDEKLDEEIESLRTEARNETRLLLDKIPMDLQSIESMVTSEKNLPNLLIKTWSALVDDVELKHRQDALSLRKQFMDQVKEYGKEGTNEDKYNAILTTDKKGNNFFLSKYDPEFMRQYKELRFNRMKARELGKGSSEYIEANNKLIEWKKKNVKPGGGLMPQDKWLDKRYTKLSGKDKEFHTFIIDKIKEADKNTLGFKSLIENVDDAEFIRLPSIRKTDLERLMAGDFKGVAKDAIKDFYQITQDTVTMGEIEDMENTGNDFIKIMTTVNNEERHLVPIHFRNPIKPENQSLDIPTIVMMNSIMASEFKYKHRIEGESQLLLDVVAEADVYKTQPVTRIPFISAFIKHENPEPVHIKGKESNLYKTLKSEIENRIYNITEATDGKMNSDNITNIARSMMGYTAHLTLAVNWMSAIPNMFQGKIQNFLESVGGATYSRKDLRWAEGKYWNEIANGALDDIGKPINSNKLNLVGDMFNTMTDFSFTKHFFEKDSRFKALFNSHSLHAFNNMAEHYAQNTLMLAVLSNVKVMDKNKNYLDSNGNITKDREAAMNFYDALEIKDGVPVLKDGVYTTDYNSDQTLGKDDIGFVQIQNLVRKKIIDMHGQYDSKLQSAMQRYWYGKAITMFRRWLIPGFYRRWRGMAYVGKAKEELSDNQDYYSLETREFEEGTYTSMVRFLVHGFWKGVREMKLEIMTKEWDKMTDYEKGNVHKTIRELLMTSLMFTAAMLTAAAAKDDPDEFDREFMFTLAYIFMRQKSELMQYWSISDNLRIFRSPFAALNSLERISRFMNQVMPWNITDQYENGERKGEYKAWVKAKQLVPVVSQAERSAERSFNYLENLLTY